MFPHMLLAVLTDSSGRVLLVRRKDSLPWTVPGGVMRSPLLSGGHFLAICCRRQIGVTPEFLAPLAMLSDAEQSVAFGTDEIRADAVRACGMVAECRWFRRNSLPDDLAPLAQQAISARAGANLGELRSPELVTAS